MKVDPTTPMFWEVVASHMKGRTGEECQQYYQQSAASTIPKKKAKPRVQKDKGKSLSNVNSAHGCLIIRENRMVDRCVRKDSSSCDPSRITQDRRSSVMRLGLRERGGGLIDNAPVSNHKNYRVLDKDIHPRYTPLVLTTSTSHPELLCSSKNKINKIHNLEL